jgi:hypothetical protein
MTKIVKQNSGHQTGSNVEYIGNLAFLLSTPGRRGIADLFRYADFIITNVLLCL